MIPCISALVLMMGLDLVDLKYVFIMYMFNLLVALMRDERTSIYEWSHHQALNQGYE